MTVLEAIQIANATGILAGGLGLFKWGLALERRVMKLELQGGTA